VLLNNILKHALIFNIMFHDLSTYFMIETKYVYEQNLKLEKNVRILGFTNNMLCDFLFSYVFKNERKKV
jgi:hypothetical protein